MKHFRSKIWAFLTRILQLDKFEGADFKYDNILFKFKFPNIQNRHFMSHI